MCKKIAIVNMLKNGTIAIDNGISWSSSTDLKFFKNTTMNSPIIMGNTTFKSLPKGPLEGRLNIVMTRQKLLSNNFNVIYVNTIHEVEDIIKHYPKAYIIGGKNIYEEFDAWDKIDEWVITHTNVVIPSSNQLKLYFYKNYTIYNHHPLDENSTNETVRNSNVLYLRKNSKSHQEYQYLKLLKNIISFGNDRDDRTNIGTKGLFGQTMTYDLRDGFPVMTTKYLNFKNILIETLWFLRGNTNSKFLESKGVNIWKGNTSREFLDSRGLSHLPEGDIGKAYGFQWRHYGAEYTTYNDNYTDKGFDQIKYVVDLIKNDPNSRRICFTGWNPADLGYMALPPCHSCFVQFYCQDNYLDITMYQRSADVGLAFGSYNVCNYAIILSIIAKMTNRIPRYLNMIGGDVHIYSNHIEGLSQQMERKPYPYPKLDILKDLNDVTDLDTLTEDDFNLIGYTHHPFIKLQMAI
jgi:thymidylate synthase